MNRSIGKSLRFRIFERDGFTCQYCGLKPPDVVLELDHIHPVSKGGDNSEMNLISACHNCNAGKRDKVLGRAIISPDADIEFLRSEQVRLEYLRYLKSSEEQECLCLLVIERLQDHWHACFDGESVPADSEIRSWLKMYSPQTIERAISTAVVAHSRRIITNRDFMGMLRYVGAVMRNLNEEVGAAS